MLSDEIPEDVIVLTWQELETPQLLHSIAPVPSPYAKSLGYLVDWYNF